MKRCLVGFVILLFAGALYAASVTIGVKGASNKYNSSVTMGVGAYSIVSGDTPKLTITLKKPAGVNATVYIIMEDTYKNECYALQKELQSGLFYSVNATQLTNCNASGYQFTELTSGGTYTYTLEINSDSYNSSAPINIYSVMVNSGNKSIVYKTDYRFLLINPGTALMFKPGNASARFNLQQ